jgi:hypothetical protein
VNQPLARSPAHWLLALLLLALPARARAERAVENREHRYRLDVDSVWRARPAPAGSLAPLAGYEHDRSGALLAVSRINYPNAAAWRQRTRDAYHDAVVAGIEKSTPGYQLMERRASLQGAVPALDLTYRRREARGNEVVLLRFLFFRRYALALAVTVPERGYRGHKRALRAVQQSFAPFFGG